MTDRERLIELIVNADVHDSYECKLCTKKDTSCTRCGAEKLADHLLANGVIVPPCMVGDTVYRIYTRSWVGEDKVDYFIITERGLYYVDDKGRETSCDKFGKTVFLTKEEAEQALKERNNGTT